MRNPSAILSVLVALLALGVLAVAGWAAKTLAEVSWLQTGAAIPVVALLAFVALSLAGRGRALHQRTLGRAGGELAARLGRGLGLLALLLALTATLALGVFGVLVATDGLTQTPW